MCSPGFGRLDKPYEYVLQDTLRQSESFDDLFTLLRNMNTYAGGHWPREPKVHRD